jgi:tRNA:m4X modification enzyme
MAPSKLDPSPEQPPLPPNWDRCCFFVERKGRYCRVRPAVEGRKYCGNHMEHEPIDKNYDDEGGQQQQHPTCKSHVKTRVPCHLCHTSVYEANLQKHMKICPVTKKRKRQEGQSYYRHNVNTGGSGLLLSEEIRTHCDTNDNEQESKWAQQVALRVLQVHQSIMLEKQHSQSSSSPSSDSDMTPQEITLDEIHRVIPLVDLSQKELDAGIERGLETHRIKSGGTEKHVPQLASLIGHLRQMEVLPDLGVSAIESNKEKNEGVTIPESKAFSSPDLVFLEMGAGRGMFGLIAAGVAACASLGMQYTINTATVHSQNNKTTLVMVERTGTRAKAEKHLRNPIPKDADTTYLKIDNIDWSRVNCDLSHVDLPTVIEELQRKQKEKQHTMTTSPTDANECNKVVQNDDPKQRQVICVIAKHLCGAGTDLALKGMESIRHNVDSCILATCCHGVCDWQHYVGRDYLRKAMIASADDEDCDDDVGLTNFGKAEFELMMRWCAASVARTDYQTGKSKVDRSDTEHQVSFIDNSSTCGTSVSNVVKTLNLSCGIQGLGRACQRLIDHGRLEYLRRDVFGDKDDIVADLCHYTSPHISPQNAILRAYRPRRNDQRK